MKNLIALTVILFSIGMFAGCTSASRQAWSDPQQWQAAADLQAKEQERQQAANQQALENQQRQQIINQQQQQLNLQQQRLNQQQLMPKQESPKIQPLSDQECGICGTPMMGTGRSQTNPNTYKLMQEYRCLKGHIAWVVGR